VKYGSIALGEAAGAILAHSLKISGQYFAKGHVLSTADVAALQSLGVKHVVALRLDPNEMPEN
jgi:molybdenum cofactor cytidylyltransferase